MTKEVEKIFLLGPSSRIRNLTSEYLNGHIDAGYKIFSYTDSIFYAKERKINPDYFLFLDPYTIGKNIDFFETDDFLSRTCLLTYDFYDNHLKKFYDFGFTCNSFIRNYNHVYNRFLSKHYEKNFSNTVTKKVECIDLFHTAQQRVDFREKPLIVSSYGKTNIDKFSCIVLPYILNEFKGLKKIKSCGFGDFDVSRFYNGKVNGYSEFTNTFDMMKENITFNLVKNKVELEFVDENYFSKGLNL